METLEQSKLVICHAGTVLWLVALLVDLGLSPRA